MTGHYACIMTRTLCAHIDKEIMLATIMKMRLGLKVRLYIGTRTKEVFGKIGGRKFVVLHCVVLYCVVLYCVV